jgi:hypothetical protein
MTLSEVREGLPFQLISKHVKSHQDARFDLTRPEQLNVLADHGATAALMISVQLTKSKSSTHFRMSSLSS